MCTVTWTVGRGGYELFFNRDELNTRAAEIAPAAARFGNVDCVAPMDGDHGGTWLLANEFGLTVCLLNDYGHAWRPAPGGARYSRGHVVLACAGARDHNDVVAALASQPLDRVAPFRIVALSPEEGPLVLHWQGVRLTPTRSEVLAPPLTSSSFATDVVVAQRTWRFSAEVRSAIVPDPRELAAFHHRHDRRAGAESVLMRRPDASTRSISHVQVTERRVQLDYQPVRWTARGPVMGEPTRLILARRDAAVAAA